MPLVAASELVVPIRAAIGAHDALRRRLIDAVDGGARDLDPGLVLRADQCDFGRWLYSTLPALSGAQSERARQVRDLHRVFHTEAIEALTLAREGNTVAARQALDGPFAEASNAMTNAMTAWCESVSTVSE